MWFLGSPSCCPVNGQILAVPSPSSLLLPILLKPLLVFARTIAVVFWLAPGLSLLRTQISHQLIELSRCWSYHIPCQISFHKPFVSQRETEAFLGFSKVFKIPSCFISVSLDSSPLSTSLYLLPLGLIHSILSVSLFAQLEIPLVPDHLSPVACF